MCEKHIINFNKEKLKNYKNNLVLCSGSERGRFLLNEHLNSDDTCVTTSRYFRNSIKFMLQLEIQLLDKPCQN